MPCLRVAEIEFKGAKRKMRDRSCTPEDGESNRPTKRRKTKEPPHIENDQRQREFLSKLSLCGTRPAILAITEPYSESFIPLGSIKNLFLQNLYSASNAGCSLDIIIKKCEEIALPVLSNEQLQRFNVKQPSKLIQSYGLSLGLVELLHPNLNSLAEQMPITQAGA